MAKAKRTRRFAVTYAQATTRAYQEAHMAHDKAAGPRLTSKSPNQAHIALVDMLAETLNLSRLEVVMRAVRLLAAEVERSAAVTETEKGGDE